ncbi:serine/threonine-protein phosphatase [Aquihabitans sp. G128]|uniref:PP2C family protein-serine/threonine phosphatase n=1 Tax=Aquihabitans sp. G128 TaxID=2849779 RepID=UPI001C21C30D|nr:PP2C family protein-serine/threonine phosphatase [Aquihabitans sp. G128]QXC62211.1 serine/threonine-protein phosphatase [Aquihabitans sp. G128]
MADDGGRTSDASLLAAMTGLLDEARRLAPHRLPGLIASAAEQLGAREARVWLSDPQQRILVHVPHSDQAVQLPEQPIDASSAGRAYSHSETVAAEDEGVTHLWVPLIDGVDRIGVLELVVADLGEAGRRRFEHLAAVAAAEIITRGQYSDTFTRRRRRRSMSLAAELQWQELPPTSFSTADVSVAGMLEPAYTVGGDTFDYAHGPDRMDLVILDSVGHDLGSSLISTLALAAYRNARRAGGDLADAARLMDRAIQEQIGRGRYATGQLGRLDTRTGVLRWLNAGHPPPLLVRRNHIAELACRPRLPFGIGHMEPDRVWEIAEDQLEPGDGVLFYTDGVIEAQALGGEDFGLDRLIDFVSKAVAADLGPAETVRRLSNAILDFHGGHLRDDATSFLVVWTP